jgi:CRP/FNR family transcriptional regulator
METTKLWHLDSASILQDLSYDEKMSLVEKTTTKKYRKSEIVLALGDKVDRLYCVAKGRVKRSLIVDKEEEQILKVYDEGDFFGELNLVLPRVGEIADRNYVAMKHDTVVCSIPLTEIRLIYQNNTALKDRLLTYYANELSKNEERLSSCLFKDVRNQLLDYIKFLAKDIGKPVGKEYLIRHQLTHQDISNITGISRQKITTLLNEFKKDGLIYFERKNILVKDKSLMP